MRRIVKNTLISFFISCLITCCCKNEPIFKEPKDLIGKWEATKLVIRTNKNIEKSFAIYKYGYAYLSLDKDSTYESKLVILKDVDIKKEILGNTYSNTVIRKGYTNYKAGKYFVTQSKINLFKKNDVIIEISEYHFDGNALVTKNFDGDNNELTIYWSKTE